MTQALDSAYPTWTVDELRAAGIVAVGRYVAFKPNGKVITHDEYVRYLSVGIAVFLVWESSGHSFTGGYAVGYAEGVEARKQARALGHPDERPVFAAYDTGTVDLNAASAYMHGFNDGGGCGPQGVYADVVVGEHLLGLGLCRMFWETNARGWPGDSIDDPRAVMVQRYAHVVAGVAGSYDVNDVFATDFGQHPRPTSTPVPLPTPAAPPVQHPTIYIGDVALHTTLISGIHLDEHGNGEVAVKEVSWEHVAGLIVIGGNNPLAPKPAGGRYDKTPVARVVNGSNPALIVITGGEPNGTYSVNVSSV